MNWTEFLHLERARKVALVEQLSSGMADVPADHQDTWCRMITEHRRYIRELDQMLDPLEPSPRRAGKRSS